MRILILILLFASFGLSADVTEKCVHVIDGDSLRLESGISVRLYGIDAPEYTMPWGPQSKKKLLETVEGKEIRIVEMDKDKYGRTVAKVYLGEIYINQMMVSSGLAWWYQRYAPDDKDLSSAELDARRNKVGLWSDPQRPEDFRRKK